MIRSIIALTIAIAPAAFAQDPHAVGPTIYKQKLANEKCRVYEITFKPGQSIAMHSHPDHVVVVTSGGTLEIEEKGKKPTRITGKPGDTFFLHAQTHRAKNVGKTTVKAYVIELKGPGGE